MHVYDNTDKAVRIIRKHKDDISIFPNPFWNEEDILDLMVWYRIAGRNAGYFDVKIHITVKILCNDIQCIEYVYKNAWQIMYNLMYNLIA